MIVAKFGGSSLADAAQFRRVRDIVLADSRRQVVVPSAPGKRFPQDEKVTDLFYQCHKARQKGEPFQPVLEVIRGRYGEIAENLGLALDLDGIFQQIWEQIARGAGPDYCASRGEFVNGQLLAEYLGFSFLDAAQAIVFDENGKLDEEETNSLLQQALLERVPVVLPGFYGRGPQGQIKVFSRGGSDVTGALAARAVGAEVYENWTDVSGFLMADPRIVQDPQPIRHLTYHEMYALSCAGATVLHEDSVGPVSRAGIATNIRNTNRPDHPGTMITSTAVKRENFSIFAGIAGRKGYSLVLLEGEDPQQGAFAQKILRAARAHGMDPQAPAVSGAHISFLVDSGEYEHEEEEFSARAAVLGAVQPPEVHTGFACIVLVGYGVPHNHRTLSRIFQTLQSRNIPVAMIHQGISEISTWVGVGEEHMEEAIRALYLEFAKGK